MSSTILKRVTNDERRGPYEPSKGIGAHLPLNYSCDSLQSPLMPLDSSDDIIIKISMCLEDILFFSFFSFFSLHSLLTKSRIFQQFKKFVDDICHRSLWTILFFKIFVCTALLYYILKKRQEKKIIKSTSQYPNKESDNLYVRFGSC
jgi:hypothetical protein